MSDQSQGPGWWQAADRKWYPPKDPPSDIVTAPPIAQADLTGSKAGWFRGWKRWVAVALGLLVVLAVLSSVLGDKDSDGDATRAGAGADVQPDDDQEVDSGSSEPESSTPATDATPEPEVAEGGTREAPWAYGATTAVTFETFGDADGSVWNVTVGSPADITDAVLAENQLNAPPPDGVAFAAFSIEMTLVEAGKEPLSAGFNSSWEFLGGSTDAVYDILTLGEGFGCGVVPDGFDDFGEVFVGGTLSGTVCIPLPIDDLADPATQVALNHLRGDRVFFGQNGITGAAAPQPTDAGGGPGDGPAPNPYGVVTQVTFATFGDADGSVWTVMVGSPADITDVVLVENVLNDPPPDGVVFVGFPVEMSLVEAGKEPLSPGFNLSWEFLGGSTAVVYDVLTLGEGFGCGVVPDGFDGFGEVFAGGTLTGTVCIPLPIEDFEDPATQVALKFLAGDRVIFGS